MHAAAESLAVGRALRLPGVALCLRFLGRAGVSPKTSGGYGIRHERRCARQDAWYDGRDARPSREHAWREPIQMLGRARSVVPLALSSGGAFPTGRQSGARRSVPVQISGMALGLAAGAAALQSEGRKAE